MKRLKLLSVSDQIVAHLHGEIMRGTWRNFMPGKNELARLFEVGISSVEEALRQLENEGILAAQGVGRPRLIVEHAQNSRRAQLRIAILSHESSNRSGGIISEVAHALREVGHDVFFARLSLLELDMNLTRIATMVKQTEADAWILCAAPREVTEWFAALAMPSLALFGRRRGVKIASVGPEKSPALAAATRRLIECGHRRIVLLCRTERRRPVPGAPERTFLNELAAHGIEPGPYHMPDWEDGMDGFQSQMKMLFEVTPPTALIVDEMKLFLATMQVLSQRKLRVPEDVSLVSMEADTAFDWCSPSIAHIRWDQNAVIRRVIGWARNVARGKQDRRETRTQADFIDGGTIGPANAGAIRQHDK